MEKLTEKINSFVVSKPIKEAIVQIAEKEELQIQQVCRRLLSAAINEYMNLQQKVKGKKIP